MLGEGVAHPRPRAAPVTAVLAGRKPGPGGQVPNRCPKHETLLHNCGDLAAIILFFLP